MRKALPLLLLGVFIVSSAAAFTEPLRATFFALDKADAALVVTPEGQRVLFDAGTNKDGKRLAKRFKDEGVDSLDVLVVSHFDKDHVGGADKVLEAVSVARVVMPAYEKESEQYTQFLDALEDCPDTQVDILETGEALAIPLEGGVSLRVTAAHEKDYGKDEENDFSLASRLVYGSTRFLFPGDAEDARQRELLEEGDVRCDVLKVPHHGRLHPATEAFLTEAMPRIAFIPDGEEEPADPELLALLEKLGTEVCRTQDGDLTVLSDGDKVWVEE